ncbi:MAG: hypothetical protein PHH36_13740, partial [Sideroxydans sp.]|nr:hypothetical protein [Sideroxydans sp.]
MPTEEELRQLIELEIERQEQEEALTTPEPPPETVYIPPPEGEPYALLPETPPPPQPPPPEPSSVIVDVEGIPSVIVEGKPTPVVEVEGIPSVIIDGQPTPVSTFYLPSGQVDTTRIGLPTDYEYSSEPYDVFVKMANEGATVRELWDYMQKHPDAIRGAYAGRLAEQVYEQLGKAGELKGREQFEAYKKIGIIPKDAEYVAGENGEWSYISPTTQEFILPSEIQLSKAQLDYIQTNMPEVYTSIQEKGIQDTFKQYGNKIIDAVNQSNIQQFELNLQEKNPYLYDIYKSAGGGQFGIDALNREIESQREALDSIPKKYIVDNRDGTVSVFLDKYIEDGQDVSLLIKAGFDKDMVQLLEMEVAQRKSALATLGTLEAGTYITKELSNKTGLPEGSRFAGLDKDGNPTYYPRSAILDTAISEIKTYLVDPSQKDDARNDSIKNALIKLDLYKEPEGVTYNFWGFYVDKDGNRISDKELTLMRWETLTQEQKDKVAELYAGDLYKTKTFAELVRSVELAGEQSYIYMLASAPVVLMGSPIAKQITQQPVTSEEWAVGGATAVLTVLSLGGSSALASAFGLGGKLATSALVGGAGGIFTPSTIAVVQNPDADLRDKAVSVAMNTLIFAGAFGSVAGLKGTEAVKTAKTTVAKAVEPTGVKVSLPVRIGEGISTTKTFFIELPNRVMSIPDAVKYYTKNLGLKAEQIADLARKGLLEVTPELANKIAANIVKAGVAVERRILTAPEAIKYYVEELGIKASQLADLARRGLLEVAPQEARLIADKIASGVVKFGVGIERRILTIPEAINYYTTELRLKSWQIYDIARRGLLEVTPELARDIARKYQMAQLNLENRIMSIPEAINYYAGTLKIEANQLAELARKGLLEVTPQQARMITDKIASNVIRAGVAVEKRILSAPEAINYYATELKLKASDIIKIAEKNWGDVSLEKVNEIVNKVQ